MMRLFHFRQGIWPIARKVLQQEAQGWVNETINTVAIPLTFFLAFGLGLEQYMSQVDGVPYMTFLAPGLITLTLLQEAFRTGAWGLWLDRWLQKMIDEYRIMPIYTTDIIMGEIIGGFIVALMKGAIVGAILMMLVPAKIMWSALPLYFLVVFPACILFTCVGAMVGTSLPKPDNIAQTQTIFITPLLYLGGLFFPLSSLPDWLQPIVHWLPTTAAFDGGRHVLLDGTIEPHYLVVLAVSAVLSFAAATWLFQRKLSQ